MKRPMICAVLAVLAWSMPAAAQGVEPGTLPPHEVLTMLRSTGFDPIGQPVRRGPNYVLRAIDDNDREVRLLISARTGDIVSVTPVAMASRMPPPPPRGGLIVGPYERMPPGYVPPDTYRPMPPGGYRPGAPVVDDDDEPGFADNPGAPRPPGALPSGPSSRPNIAARPLPPRGAAQRDDDEAMSSEPNVIMADPDRGGVLPPPPERFPQRVAPLAPARPKPVQRAATMPLKQAPLPKPKPSAAGAPATPSGPAPQKAPGVDETPN